MIFTLLLCFAHQGHCSAGKVLHVNYSLTTEPHPLRTRVQTDQQISQVKKTNLFQHWQKVILKKLVDIVGFRGISDAASDFGRLNFGNFASITVQP